MTGIAAMFLKLSQPDEFEAHYQLELFAWARRQGLREAWRDRKRQSRGVRGQTHHCSVCHEPGHRGRWRGEVLCARAA